jgi:surfeit locus 1 family protein
MEFVARVKGKKSFTEFLAPGDLKGTRVLALSPTEIYVYLPEFQKIIVDCDFQASQRVELQTIHDGVPGVRLISACRGRLIDLGFISEEISARPPFTQYQAPRPSGSYPKIIAEVRNTPAPNSFALPPENGRFFARDNRAIAAALGAPPESASQTLYAVTAAFPGFGALQPSAPPAAFSNNHLGYALTWFGLALALVGFYIVLLRRTLKQPRSASEAIGKTALKQPRSASEAIGKEESS